MNPLSSRRDDIKAKFEVPKLAQDFGAKLREARKQAGLSQAALAQRVGTHQVYISLIERGSENPTLAACEKYAKALGQKVIIALSTDDGAERNAADLRLLDLIAKQETILAELARMRAELHERRGKKQKAVP